MFTAKLICENCGFATRSFMTCYYPPGDKEDIVFQNLANGAFRVVSCEGVARRTERNRPTEQELEAVIDQLRSEMRQQNEEFVDVWVSPDDFTKRTCPECHQQQAVALNLLSII
jgi:hypothetical protein